MITSHTKLKIWTFALLFLSILFMTGCQSTATFYRGYNVTDESIFPLSSVGTQQGTWKSTSLDISFQYQYANNSLDISGTIKYSLYHQLNTSRIKSMDVYLFFLDNASKVMETASIYWTLWSSPEENITFSKILRVPDGATSIAFGYKGIALEDIGIGLDEISGGQQYFNDLPKRPK